MERTNQYRLYVVCCLKLSNDQLCWSVELIIHMLIRFLSTNCTKDRYVSHAVCTHWVWATYILFMNYRVFHVCGTFFEYLIQNMHRNWVYPTMGAYGVRMGIVQYPTKCIPVSISHTQYPETLGTHDWVHNSVYLTWRFEHFGFYCAGPGPLIRRNSREIFFRSRIRKCLFLFSN